MSVHFVLKRTDNCPPRSLIISCCLSVLLSVLLSDLIGEMESASLFKRINGFSFSSDQNKPARLAERNEKIESWDLSLVEYPTRTTIVEQDHRFIKRRVKPGLGFFSIESAWRTLQGYEVMNMVRKGYEVWKKGTSWGRLHSLPACLEWPPKRSKR